MLALPPLCRYGLVGLFSTMLDFLVLNLLLQFSVNPGIAKGASYAFAAGISYTLHRNWTFRSQAPIAQSLFQFLATNLVSLFANVVFFSLILELSQHVFIAAVSAFFVASLVNFLGYRIIFLSRHS